MTSMSPTTPSTTIGEPVSENGGGERAQLHRVFRTGRTRGLGWRLDQLAAIETL